MALVPLPLPIPDPLFWHHIEQGAVQARHHMNVAKIKYGTFDKITISIPGSDLMPRSQPCRKVRSLLFPSRYLTDLTRSHKQKTQIGQHVFVKQDFDAHLLRVNGDGGSPLLVAKRSDNWRIVVEEGVDAEAMLASLTVVGNNKDSTLF